MPFSSAFSVSFLRISIPLLPCLLGINHVEHNQAFTLLRLHFTIRDWDDSSQLREVFDG